MNKFYFVSQQSLNLGLFYGAIYFFNKFAGVIFLKSSKDEAFQKYNSMNMIH